MKTRPTIAYHQLDIDVRVKPDACAQVMNQWGMNFDEIQGVNLSVLPSVRYYGEAPTSPVSGMLRPARYNAQERTLSLYTGSMVRRHSKENAGLDRNLAWSHDIAMGLSYCVDYTVFGENAVAMENDRARRHTLWGQRCRWVIPNTAVFAGFAGAAFAGEHELHLFDNRIGWALGAVVAAGAMTAASVISLKQARAVTEDRCRQNNIAANWPIDARARIRAAEYLRQARAHASVAPLLAIVG